MFEFPWYAPRIGVGDQDRSRWACLFGGLCRDMVAPGGCCLQDNGLSAAVLVEQSWKPEG